MKLCSILGRMFGHLICCLVLTQCGYAIRSTSNRSPILESAGIRKVYIKPVVNNSYKAGVEITVYNALQKKILGQGELIQVSNEADADAILTSTVESADFSPVSSTAGSSLEPTAQSAMFKTYAVASVYSAILSVKFQLAATTRSRLAPGQRGLWSSQFSRNRTFQANKTVGALGTTSATIDDSEFDRALADLADTMMVDVNESLLSMF